MGRSIVDFFNENMQHAIPLIATACTMIAIVFFLSLTFFGAGYQNEERLNQVRILCVDLDNDTIGHMFMELCATLALDLGDTKPLLVRGIYEDFDAVVSGVNHGHSFATVVVKEGASARLRTEIERRFFPQEGVEYPEYKSTDAVVMLYDEGRCQQLINPYLRPTIYHLGMGFPFVISLQVLGGLFATDLADWNAIELAPHAPFIFSAVSYTETNLHPVHIVGTLALIIGPINMVVFAFMWLMAAHEFFQPILQYLDAVWRKCAFLILIGHVITFFISLAYSGSVAVYTGVKHEVFINFWMLNWLQMNIYYGAMVIAFPFLQQKLGLVFVMFLILNITASIFHLDVEQRFYRWGYAAPFWHVDGMNRHLLFGSWNRTYLHIPVLVGQLIFSNWIAIPAMVLFHKHVMVPHGFGIVYRDAEGVRHEAK